MACQAKSMLVALLLLLALGSSDALIAVKDDDILLNSVAYFDQEYIGVGQADAMLHSTAHLVTMESAVENKSRDKSGNNTLVPLVAREGFRPCTSPSGILLADLKAYSIENITRTAQNWYMDFVILIIDDHDSWKDRFHFWWSPQAYLSNVSAPTPPYFLAVSRNTGKVLSDLLEDTRFNTTKDWHECLHYIELRFDDLNAMQGKDLAVLLFLRILFYLLFICSMVRWFSALYQDDKDDKPRVQFTGNELGQGVIQEGTFCECAICLEAMPAGTKVRILPCRHAFHHDCIVGWFNEDKYTCPMCKMDLGSHLTEQRVAAGFLQTSRTARRYRWGRGLWRRIQADENQLLDGLGGQENFACDLELAVEESYPTPPTPTNSPTSVSSLEDGVIA